MLKKITINNQSIPVPVPILTLGDAIEWVNTTFARQGRTVTKVSLNGADVWDDLNCSPSKVAGFRLASDSQVKVQMESPHELAVHTLETIRNLSTVIDAELKPLAVSLWQNAPNLNPQAIPLLLKDLKLILELIQHMKGLVDHTHQEVAGVQGLGALLADALVRLGKEYRDGDLRMCAKILLNKVETYLRELTNESESLQMHLLANMDD